VFAYLLLRALGFTHGIATLGTVSLLFATTFLHYVQICQENNLMLAMSLAGCFRLLRWLDSGAARYAALAGAAFGFSLLIRLTTMGDTGGAFVFLALALWWGPRRPLASLAWFLPPFLAGAAVERGYQFLRFAQWGGTYYSSQGVQHLFPPRPPGIGLGTSLWMPQNSIFLYDPLLPLALILLIAFWAATAPRVRALALGALSTLATSRPPASTRGAPAMCRRPFISCACWPCRCSAPTGAPSGARCGRPPSCSSPGAWSSRSPPCC